MVCVVCGGEQTRLFFFLIPPLSCVLDQAFLLVENEQTAARTSVGTVRDGRLDWWFCTFGVCLVWSCTLAVVKNWIELAQVKVLVLVPEG